jgi:hypothetical protein
MKNMKFVYVLFVAANCSFAQDEKLANTDLTGEVLKLETSKLVFFSRELVEVCMDTSMLITFEKRITQIGKSLEGYDEGDRKEKKLVLKLLHDSIANRTYTEKSVLKVKERLLKVLSKYQKLDFKVDDMLISSQLDNSARSLRKGYDEGAVSESRFVFFVYNPWILKNVLMSHGMSDKWKRTGVFLCNFIRENETPVAARKIIQARILHKLSELPRSEDFDKISQDFAKCDISSNRND